MNKLYHLKRAMKKYLMALMVRDFSALSEFARMDNAAFRYMKHLVPGPLYLHPALHGERRPQAPRSQPPGGGRAHARAAPSPMPCSPCPPKPVILTTAAKIQEEDILIDPVEIEEQYGHLVDLIVDLGPMPVTPTTVIALRDDGGGSNPRRRRAHPRRRPVKPSG